MSAFTRKLAAHPYRLVAATLVLAVAGGLTLAVEAAAPPHGGPGGPGAPMMMMGDPAHMSHMLDLVDATPEQRSQITAIMDGARADLKAQHDGARGLQDQAMTLFTQPTVDARAAESLRQQMLAQHDQASKRMMQAMLDVSRVLTPEQRQQIGAKMAERRAMMERHRAEHDGPAAAKQ